MGKMLKGVATVALAAGAVVVGAVLMDKQTRNKVGKGAKKALEKASEVASKYEPVAHKVTAKARKMTSKS